MRRTYRRTRLLALVLLAVLASGAAAPGPGSRAGAFGGLASLAGKHGSGYDVCTPSRWQLAMKARIVRVGNSRGIRIPKPLLDQAGLTEDVELHAEPGRIVIAALKRPRDGWAQAAQRMAARGEDGLLDPPTPTQFDAEEWEWR